MELEENINSLYDEPSQTGNEAIRTHYLLFLMVNCEYKKFYPFPPNTAKQVGTSLVDLK